MTAGKHAQPFQLGRHTLGKKGAAMIAALALAFGVAVAGTLAWLSDQTEPVVNTFTYGDINITLTETDTDDGDDDPNTNEYKMMPGATITKDPQVTVKHGSENCWLFVKLEESANFDDFLTYDVDPGTGQTSAWTQLKDDADKAVEGVFYRKVEAADVEKADAIFTVLKDNTVSVKPDVTKDMLNKLDATADLNYPKLSVTAYAVQSMKSSEPGKESVEFTPFEAWQIATNEATKQG